MILVNVNIYCFLVDIRFFEGFWDIIKFWKDVVWDEIIRNEKKMGKKIIKMLYGVELNLIVFYF